MRIAAVIPAAGSGRRFGSPVPKQFLKAAGKEIIVHTLEVFQSSRLITDIAVAVHPDYAERMKRLARKYHLTKLRQIIHGGKERSDSVFAALSALSLNDGDFVAVHDAARPLLTPALLRGAIAHAKEHGSAVVAIKARDTLLAEEARNRYPNRETIYYVQTPQIFRCAVLRDAFRKAAKYGWAVTDESMLVHRAGGEVSLCAGSLRNFKITSREDYLLFKEIVGQ